MEERYFYFFLVPLAGFLADIAILIVNYFSQKRSISRFSLSIFYVGIAIWNLILFIGYLSRSEEEAKNSFFYMYTIQLLMTNSFLLFCMEQSQQPLQKIEKFLKISLIFSGIWYILLLYSYFFTEGNQLFIYGVKKYEWGYYPIAGYGSYITHIYWGFIFISSLNFLIRYNLQHPEDKRTKIITILFILMIIASISNFIVIWEKDILPLGNAADAILSTILAAVFYREQFLESKAKFFLKLAGIISSIGLTLLLIWLFLDLVVVFQSHQVIFFVLSVLISFFSLLFFNILFSPPVIKRSFEETYQILRRKYNLTHQEAMICKFIMENKERKEILRILNISGNTLKVQLNSIYKKTIEKLDSVDTNRNKFPLLKKFLEEVNK